MGQLYVNERAQESTMIVSIANCMYPSEAWYYYLRQLLYLQPLENKLSDYREANNLKNFCGGVGSDRLERRNGIYKYFQEICGTFTERRHYVP